jgi:hypothetical protein
MRCHSASSLFSAIFVFQKSYTGNILGIGRNKSHKAEKGHKASTPLGGVACPLPAPTCGEGPLVHLWRRPFAYKDPITFPEYITIRHHRRPEIGRVQKLFPAPCRRGQSPPEVFFIAMLASGAMSE